MDTFSFLLGEYLGAELRGHRLSTQNFPGGASGKESHGFKLRLQWASWMAQSQW